MMLAAAFDIGTIAGWLSAIGIAAVAFLVYRGGGSTALSVLTVANDVLEKRVTEQDRTLAEYARTIEELRARTDIALALHPLIEAVISHEEASAARQAKTVAILAAIADRLGAEPSPPNEPSRP